MKRAAEARLSGRVDFSFITWSFVRPLVDAGQLKLLAFNYPTRVPGYENVPTLMELYPDMKPLPSGFWDGIVGPAGIPADVVAKIDAGIKAATSSESFKQRIEGIGSYPTYKTPAETDAFFRNEMKAWDDLVKKQHIVIQQ